MQLYKYAVIGAKAADPAIRIAGPSTVGLDQKSSLDGSAFESPNSMMQDIIEYAGTHSLNYDNNEEGVHLNYDKYPIDIISFSGLNQYGSDWKIMADQIRRWLSTNGYDANIPLLVQEFGTWLIGNYLDEKRDSEYIAAYLINQLATMEKATIGDYYFTTLFDSVLNETLRAAGTRLHATTIFVAAVQEEVGLRGATQAAGRITPDLCIGIDATVSQAGFGSGVG